MPDMIRDGKGRGFLAGVNNENELNVRASSVEQRLVSSTHGKYFETTTKTTLTDANDTAMIFLQNTDATGCSIVIDRIFYDSFTSTGGTGADGTLTYYINPTANTSAAAISPTNTNFGSTAAAEGVFYSGNTAIDAFAGGAVWWTAYITDKQSIALEEGRIVIPNGSSFGIKVAPPTGNTSMEININVAFYYFDISLIG